MEDREAKPKRRPRVSLLSLLLLVALVGTALAIGRQVIVVREHERRIARYRDELGSVSMPKPKRLYVKTLEGGYPERLFRWRVYVPPGHSATACLSQGTSTSRGRSCHGMPSGESTFEVIFFPNDEGTWTYRVRSGGQARRGWAGGGGDPEPPWLGSPDKRSRLELKTNHTDGAGPGETVELLRYEDDPADLKPITLSVTVSLHEK